MSVWVYEYNNEVCDVSVCQCVSVSVETAQLRPEAGFALESLLQLLHQQRRLPVGESSEWASG